MVDVRDVAKWFLSQDSMTHKKLQKLCYYAQAWHCALYGEPLFKDEIQAWVHGPVCPTLFRIYRDYDWREIPQNDFDDSVLSDRTMSVLYAVCDAYGDYTGDQLEDLTHSEEPWREARGDLQPWEICTTPISCATMGKYYAKIYEQAQNQ